MGAFPVSQRNLPTDTKGGEFGLGDLDRRLAGPRMAERHMPCLARLLVCTTEEREVGFASIDLALVEATVGRLHSDCVTETLRRFCMSGRSSSRRFLATTIIILGTVLTTVVQAALASATDACGVDSAILQWLNSSNACPSAPYTVVLTYSHSGHIWAASRYKCENGRFTRCRDEIPIEIAVGNAAVLKIRSTDDVRVLVTDTNPLLYTVGQTAATEADSPDVAQLQGFLSLLGGTIGKIFAASSQFDLVVAPANATVMATDFQTKRQLLKLFPDDERVRKEFPSDVADAINSFNAVMRARVAAIAAQYSLLDTARSQLAQRVDEVGAAAGSIRLAVQQLEDGDTPGAGWANVGVADLVGSTGSRIAELRQAARAVASSSTACTAPLTQLAEVVGMALKPTPEATLAATQISYDEKLTALLSSTLLETQGCDQVMAEAIDGVAEQLGRISPTKEGMVGELAKAWTRVRSGARVYVDTAAEVATAREAATKALAAVPTLEDAVSQLAAFEGKLKALRDAANLSSAAVGAECGFRSGIIEVYRGAPKWKWNKVYSEEAKISASKDAIFKNVVLMRPAEQTIAYKLVPHRTTQFSLSFGLIYTEIVDPSWGAVTDPLDTTKKVIARTDESSRAGQPALLLTLHPWDLKENRWSPGLDIGAGYSSGSPGAFLGLSVGLTPYLRLGAGWTWQQVSRLDHSQTEMRFLDDGTVDPESLTVVASKDDILKRTHFEDDYYVSLVFNLSGFQLFKPKD